VQLQIPSGSHAVLRLAGTIGAAADRLGFSCDEFPKRDSGRTTENGRDKTSAKKRIKLKDTTVVNGIFKITA
jgi:hypothetical protein